MTVNHTFKLYGTQNNGLIDFDDYDASAPDWKHYSIPIGQYYAEEMLYLFFGNDHDVTSPTAESYFSNVQIHGAVPTPTPSNTPTITPTPTKTNTPTSTPTSTPTPMLTFTATGSPTITFTPSNTPTPMTYTPIPGTPQSNGSGVCWASGLSWNDYNVEFDIKLSGDSAVPSGWVTVIHDAKDAWNDVVPSGFTLTREFGSANQILYETPSLGSNYLADVELSYNLFGNRLAKATMRVNPDPPDGSTPPNILVWDYQNSPPPPGHYSVQAVVTHEFGHWVDLHDIYLQSCDDVTMYKSIAPAQDEENTLEIEDINGLNWQYP